MCEQQFSLIKGYGRVTYINKIIWKYCFLWNGYENTWQSLSVVLRGTTQMSNIKSADEKVT